MNLERLDNPLELNRSPGPQASRLDSLATVLSRAYHGNPSLTYLIPGAEVRRIVSPSLFLSVIRAGQLYGEIHTTENGDCVSVWINPAYEPSSRRIVRVSRMSLPLGLEWGIAHRCMKLAANIQEIRKRLAPLPHWHLMVLGAETCRPEKAVGEALVEPVLLRADSKGIPCYLQTFSEENLAFYRNYGFKVTGAGRISGGGPNFWALTRAA
jgi:hypothetical protein